MTPTGLAGPGRLSRCPVVAVAYETTARLTIIAMSFL
jgi:hypothetical protein